MFAHLVLSGGSVGATAILGCVKRIEELGWMSSIRAFVGTSAGSMIAFLMVLGFTSQEIITFIYEHIPILNLGFQFEDIFKLLHTTGMNDGSVLREFGKLALRSKLQLDSITFMDLSKRTGKHLVVSVSNITQGSIEYWSVDTKPDMDVLFAISTSCALPILFTPVSHNGSIYADGGIFDNFPANYFETSSTPAPLKDTLGIWVKQTDAPRTSFDTILDYMYTIVSKLLVKTNYKTITPKAAILEIVVSPPSTEHDLGGYGFSIDTMQFNITYELFQAYIDIGYQQFKTFETQFQKHNSEDLLEEALKM